MRIEENTFARLEPADWLWPQDVAAAFESEQPLELDLGCGKGRFILARAAAHPDINYLGIERQLIRVRKIDRKINQRRLTNVRLFRIEGTYAMRYLMPADAFQTVYIFHPDPWPKKRHAAHRILGADFIDDLHRVLKPGGLLHFSTDHLPYFYQVVDLLEADERFAEAAPFVPAADQETDFERIFKTQKPIGRYSVRKLGDG